jgi:hypothetical protein
LSFFGFVLPKLNDARNLSRGHGEGANSELQLRKRASFMPLKGWQLSKLVKQHNHELARTLGLRIKNFSTLSGIRRAGRRHVHTGLLLPFSFVVPLCGIHHREIHRCGNEEEWWQNFG